MCQSDMPGQTPESSEHLRVLKHRGAEDAENRFKPIGWLASYRSEAPSRCHQEKLTAGTCCHQTAKTIPQPHATTDREPEAGTLCSPHSALVLPSCQFGHDRAFIEQELRSSLRVCHSHRPRVDPEVVIQRGKEIFVMHGT